MPEKDNSQRIIVNIESPNEFVEYQNRKKEGLQFDLEMIKNIIISLLLNYGMLIHRDLRNFLAFN